MKTRRCKVLPLDRAKRGSLGEVARRAGGGKQTSAVGNRASATSYRPLQGPPPGAQRPWGRWPAGPEGAIGHRPSAIGRRLPATGRCKVLPLDRAKRGSLGEVARRAGGGKQTSAIGHRASGRRSRVAGLQTPLPATPDSPQRSLRSLGGDLSRPSAPRSSPSTKRSEGVWGRWPVGPEGANSHRPSGIGYQLPDGGQDVAGRQAQLPT